jgi:hypothetical protein
MGGNPDRIREIKVEKQKPPFIGGMAEFSGMNYFPRREG